jgi:hypothetical protein
MRHYRPVCRPVWPTPPRPKGLCGHLSAEERLESPGPSGQRDCPGQPSPGRGTSNPENAGPGGGAHENAGASASPAPAFFSVASPSPLRSPSVLPPFSLRSPTVVKRRDDGGRTERRRRGNGGTMGRVAGRGAAFGGGALSRNETLRSEWCRWRLLPGHQVHPAHSTMECCGRLDHKSAAAFPVSHWLGSSIR